MTKFKKIFALVFVFAISIGVFAGHNALADNSSRSAECGKGEAIYHFDTTGYSEYFSLPGGEGHEPPKPATCQTKGLVTLTNVPIYQGGYTGGEFEGWVVKGTTAPLIKLNEKYDLQYDVVFVPVFTPEKVKISFDLAGGTIAGGGEGMPPYEVDYGVTIPEFLLATDWVTNQCKELEGWQVNGASVDASTVVTSDITMVAQWSTDNMCNVSINLNGGTVDGFEGPLPMKVEYNKAIEPAYLEELNIIKEGYTLSGWNPQLPQTVTDNNLELTAQWTVNKYNVDLNFAGGKTAEGAESGQLTLPYGTEITEEMLNVLGLNKEGNTLAGWDVELPYTVNAEENQTLTAQWTVNDYKIDLDFAGGKTTEGGVEGQLTLPYGTEITEEMFNNLGLIKEGYTLQGWKVNGEGEIIKSFVVPAQDVTLVAQWEAIDGGNGGETTPPTEPGTGEPTEPTEPGTGEPTEPTEPTEKLPETGSDAMVMAVVALLSATGLIAVRKLRA